MLHPLGSRRKKRLETVRATSAAMGNKPRLESVMQLSDEALRMQADVLIFDAGQIILGAIDQAKEAADNATNEEYAVAHLCMLHLVDRLCEVAVLLQQLQRDLLRHRNDLDDQDEARRRRLFYKQVQGLHSNVQYARELVACCCERWKTKKKRPSRGTRRRMDNVERLIDFYLRHLREPPQQNHQSSGAGSSSQCSSPSAGSSLGSSSRGDQGEDDRVDGADGEGFGYNGMAADGDGMDNMGEGRDGTTVSEIEEWKEP